MFLINRGTHLTLIASAKPIATHGARVHGPVRIAREPRALIKSNQKREAGGSKKSLVLFLAALSMISVVFAQSFVGGVRGLIQDPGGAVIASANVTLRNDAT